MACGWFRVVGWVVDRVVDGWEVRKRLRGLYPIKNADFVIAF